MIPPNLLPDGTEAFIAGGYAACPALAADIDVWVPVAIGDKDRVRERILAHLRQRQAVLSFEEEDPDNSARQRFQQDRTLANSQLLSTFEGYHLVIGLRRVAKVSIPGASLPYHLIVVEGSVDDVLSSFDITTHQVALTEKGVVTGEQWTPLSERPRVIREKYTTPARLQKICTRYGWAG